MMLTNMCLVIPIIGHVEWEVILVEECVGQLCCGLIELKVVNWVVH